MYNNHATSQNNKVGPFVPLTLDARVLNFIVSINVSHDVICKGIPQPSRSEDIVWVIAGITAITFPMIALRMISRLIVAQLWWDDWIMLLTTVSPDSRRIAKTVGIYTDGEADIHDSYVSHPNLKYVLTLSSSLYAFHKKIKQVSGAAKGFGKHSWDIPPANLPSLLQVLLLFYSS